MAFSRPIQWYHSHADPIWPDGTFNCRRGSHILFLIRSEINLPQVDPHETKMKKKINFLKGAPYTLLTLCVNS